MAASQSKDRCLCIQGELDLFQPPAENHETERGEWVAHHPISSLTDHSPLEWQIAPDLEHYSDISRAHLYLSLRLVKHDGSNQTDANKTAHGQIAPVDNIFHSLFSSVQLRVNNTVVTPSDTFYPYRAYIENLMNGTPEARNSWMRGELFYGDMTHGEAFAAESEDVVNPDLKTRHQLFAEGASVEVMGRLKIPLVNQSRFLCPGLEMGLKLTRTSNAFYLMGRDVSHYKIEIQSAVFHTRRVKVSAKLAVEHARLLSGGHQALYPFTRTEVTSFAIPIGSLSFNRSQVNTGFLPQRVVVGFVTNRAQNGAGKVNPYLFEHHHLSHLQLSLGGQNFPTEAYAPDYRRGHYLRNYTDLAIATAVYGSRDGLMIDYDAYPKHCCLYAFDLTAGLTSATGPAEARRFGSLALDVRFRHPLDAAVNAIVYAEFASLIKIDFSRNITADYITH